MQKGLEWARWVEGKGVCLQIPRQEVWGSLGWGWGMG